ncbi:MAG: DUF4139 domain-containing protein [Leptospiraceae bacterium]|nr:mucoidy inhibitor MuiA family protein [Leptospiraceae bacterium]MCK6382332.1 DUF4139 domain-containing protein [Leptospiraceae bacterium]NUM40890.1 mucoidy inhibitor MuiA family protein [Leptospiraceae bacterium]
MNYSYLLFFVFLFSLFTGDIFSESIDTKITQVRLYQNKAYVRRSGELDIKKHLTSFYIENIPESIIDRSINISFEPKKFPIKVKRVQVVEIIEKVFQNEQAKEAKIKYDELLKKLNLLNKEFSILISHKEKINSITAKKKESNFSVPEIQMNPSIWNTVQKTISVMLEENAKQEIAKLEEIDNLREELLVAEAKLDFYKRAEEKVRKKIIIDFQSSLREKIQFHVDYMVSGAEWYPHYAVKVDTVTKINSLFFYALVRNNTGEDWQNVDFSFSAADPNQNSDLPILKEWRIGYEEIQDDLKPQISPKQSRRRISEEKEMPSSKLDGQISDDSLSSDTLSTDDEEVENYKPRPRKKSEKKKFKPQEANEYSPQQTDIQAQSKNFLTNNAVQSRSFATENNLNSLKNDFQNLQDSFASRNYSDAIDYGKQAKEKILRLNERYRKELIQTSEKIEEISRRSAILQSNSKLGVNLISPISSSGGFDYRYFPKSKETILSDNSFNKIMINIENLNSELYYETSPISQKSVFMSASSLSRNKEPLLAGPLDIFVKEDFLGTSILNMTSKGEKLKFDLGPDNNIEVDRRETKYREKKGILSEKNSVKTSIEIQLKNKKNEKIQLRVIDRIPYTFDKDIEVELIHATHNPEKKNYGAFYFNISLNPGEEKKIQFEYIVKYPAKNILKEGSGAEIE